MSPPGAVFLIRHLEVGGAERVLVGYANGLRRYRPTVALVERRGDLLAELTQAIPVVEIGVPHGPALPASAWALWREARRLARAARGAEAAIVSSFLFRQHLIALAARDLFDSRLRVVVNIHEHMTGSAPHLYPNPVDRALMRWCTRHLVARADAIVAVADGVRDDLVERFGIPAGRISVVRNPLPIAWLRERASEPVGWPPGSLLPGGPTIAAVGRLIPLKGFDILLRAFALLPAGLDARLVVVGDGPERDGLERLATDLGLDRRVAFVGKQANPWAFMARSAVLALSSLTEALPLVLTEAMALGCPVVATECSPGVRELLSQGADGVLVAPGDPAALALGLEHLLTDSDRRRVLAERGRRRAEDYSLAVAVRAYEEVLARAGA